MEKHKICMYIYIIICIGKERKQSQAEAKEAIAFWRHEQDPSSIPWSIAPDLADPPRFLAVKLHLHICRPENPGFFCGSARWETLKHSSDFCILWPLWNIEVFFRFFCRLCALRDPPVILRCLYILRDMPSPQGSAASGLSGFKIFVLILAVFVAAYYVIGPSVSWPTVKEAIFSRLPSMFLWMPLW